MDNDIELIELAKTNNIALEKLMRIYEPMMYKVVRKYKIGGHTQEDLMQEARDSFCQAVKVYDKEKSKLSTFAYTFINNRMKTLQKTDKALKRNATVVSIFSDDNDDGIALDIPSNKPGPEDIVILNERIQEIKSRLTAFEFEVAMLYAKGYSYNSIAEKMNKTVKNIDNTLQRVKRKLKD